MRPSYFKKRIGFTLVELMVVVAIIGILVRLGYPQMNAFVAKARQAEAQLNLGMIHKLQESYLIEQDKYYNGVGGVLNTGSGFGYLGSGSSHCESNPLGLKVSNCNELRYKYTVTATDGDFAALAAALSDGDKRIFPRCAGTKNSTVSVAFSSATCSNPGDGAAAISHTHTYTRGDVWCTDPSRKMNNFVNIVENCN